ncbi:uncharacterized protein LOC125046485 [Penaeus chinensis]|uniref:uncharacterized protein LOC125046485 n=1 Tax=Penaeus chinensis TaxID=139456 RepID=UPI001FB5CD14|nr:uncharacterized protein LOC125046485 [Penaeus chinensis]
MPGSSSTQSLALLLALAALGGAAVTERGRGSSQASRREEPIVLPPITDEGVEAALLIIPGAFINGEFYQPLGEAIQAASSLKLWVALVRPFLFDLPNPSDLIPDLDNTLQTMRDLGMTTDQIFLGGHSLGGVILQDAQWTEENGVKGWVLMASYLPAGALANISLPVMHISGDLDGQDRVTHVMMTFDELEDTLEENPANVYTKPVVVLEDVNHMHFGSGEPPAAVAAMDILSPMSQDDAQALIASHVSAFLTIVTGQPEANVPEAQQILDVAHVSTSIIIKPLQYLTAVTEGDGLRSEWSERGQWFMSTVAEEDRGSMMIMDTIYPTTSELASSKPSIVLDGLVANVTTCTHVYSPTIAEGIDGLLTASQMAVKFKSREAVMEVLSPLGVHFKDEISCKEVNEAAFQLALDSASDIARQRFSSRGRPVVFHADDVKLTGSGWLGAHLGYNDTDTGLEITSPSLPTAVDVGFGLGGMHYCKLLAPSRALEYIMVDSLRGTQP